MTSLIGSKTAITRGERAFLPIAQIARERVEESACRNESKLALACATSQPADDKSACDELFQAYKDCRKLEHERIVQERIERRRSAF